MAFEIKLQNIGSFGKEYHMNMRSTYVNLGDTKVANEPFALFHRTVRGYLCFTVMFHW